ncbi:peptide chain release factor-like protein [Candidatus Vidania fulgoroideorum]
MFNYILYIENKGGGKDSEDCTKIIKNQYIKYFKKKNIKYIKKKNYIELYGSKSFERENGLHKIIRYSPYKNNSIHTSYCKVIFLKKSLYLENIYKKDIKYYYTKSSGAGGQHVNKTNSCVKLFHAITNTKVKCQKERSQNINKKIAEEYLKKKIIKKKKKELNKKNRKKKNEFNDTIRIYYFNKSIAYDKILKKKINIIKIIKGNIDFLFS